MKKEEKEDEKIDEVPEILKAVRQNPRMMSSRNSMLDDQVFQHDYKLRDRYKTVSRLNKENEDEKLKYEYGVDHF